ncbi:MAG: TIM barrel protein [Clostridia bacterium]|nr:TIM barrel protein [Clostridia bacterium]
MILGAQLFTLRDHCRDLASLENTLARVAALGYTAVQLSAVCPYDPEWMRTTLQKYGLSAPITHFDFKKITQNKEETSAFHKGFGADYIGIGCSPFSFDEEGFSALVTPLLAVGSYYRDEGQKLMYHNHNMEFSRHGDGLFFDKLVNAFPKDTLGITLDTYWVQAGGGDPAFWLKKLSGRVDCIHLKDMSYSLADRAIRMAPVGSGNMNFEAILAAAESAGTKYAFVEQDNCYEEDPFVCLKKSYDYLASVGLS